MQVLRFILKILVVCGCWRPPSWTSPIKKLLYTMYTVFLFIILYITTFLQIMDLILYVENQDELSDNIYLMLTMVVSCHKMYSMLINQRDIAVLTNILEREPFQPENEEEIEIRSKSDQRARLQTFVYLTLVETTVIIISFGGILKADDQVLVYRMWIPYKHSSSSTLTFSYIQQTIALIAGSVMHIACDSLIWGLLIHTCSQMEILASRLKAIKEGDNQSAKLSAYYHNLVYRFASMINEIFEMVITVQFAASTMVVCFNLYIFITIEETSSKLFIIISYTSCMMMQIFQYCWHGNEVKLKSLEISNVIFETDWPLLDKATNKLFLMIMRRAATSIELKSGHVVPMNLESFVNILKTSYSAYNVLKGGQ